MGPLKIVAALVLSLVMAALTSRATILVTREGNHLSLPNALEFKSV